MNYVGAIGFFLKKIDVATGIMSVIYGCDEKQSWIGENDTYRGPSYKIKSRPGIFYRTASLRIDLFYKGPCRQHSIQLFIFAVA